MTATTSESERTVYKPSAFEGSVDTAADALEAAALLLEEEGGSHWTTCAWYTPNIEAHENRESRIEASPDNPYCGSWGACADGALRMVTVGLFRATRADEAEPGCNCAACTEALKAPFYWSWDIFDATPGRELYERSINAVTAAMEDDEKYGTTELVQYNDMTASREGVVALFREAKKFA